ncbi:hypothetical protein B0H11DRAFT_1914999 [Mycena galericulata]|nr:hypothetical protein B0H11DRAFT_1914999 [Mycena galericulata]
MTAAAIAHRRAATTYRWNHAEELRGKARVRMAKRRQMLKEQEVLDEKPIQRAREADKKYRIKAYVSKHGRQAFLDRCVREQEALDKKRLALLEARAAAKERRAQLIKHELQEVRKITTWTARRFCVSVFMRRIATERTYKIPGFATANTPRLRTSHFANGKCHHFDTFKEFPVESYLELPAIGARRPFDGLAIRLAKRKNMAIRRPLALGVMAEKMEFGTGMG